MRAIRAGICVLAAFAVFTYGAVEVWSQAVLAAGAAALFLLWGARVARRRDYELRGNWLLVPLAGILAVVILQRVFRLTAYPYVTQISLLDWLAYVLLFFLALQTYRYDRQWRGFFWFLLGLGFLVALIGIAQYFTSPGKLYWFQPLRHGGTPFGPFVNRNNFAGFAELVVPPGLALLLLGGVRSERMPLVAVLTLVPVAALALSASRGGIVSFVCQLVLLLLLLWKYGPGLRQWKVGLGLAVLAGLLVAWVGVSRAVRRFAAPRETQISLEKRMAMVRDTWHIFLDHPVVGTGMGTLETVYPRYETHFDGRVVNHAHNDYLELLSDTGIAGGCFGLAFLLLLLWGGFRNIHRTQSRMARSFHAGALVSCVGLLVHGFVDFNLHIPSNALLFILLAYFAFQRLPAREPEHARPSRF